MSKHQPPSPPGNVSPKGPGGSDRLEPRKTGSTRARDQQRNLAQQGRQGNTRQNTTHQGYQQDR